MFWVILDTYRRSTIINTDETRAFRTRVRDALFIRKIQLSLGMKLRTQENGA